MKYRFKSLDISNIGPFGQNNVLDFKDGINVVGGQNFSGKTTLANALLGNISNAPIQLLGTREATESFLLGYNSQVDGFENLPQIGQPFPLFQRIISKIV